jgi:ABC-type sugar transport system permease subunit
MKRKTFFTLRRQDAFSGYAFLLPWIVGFFTFTAFPFFYSVYLSFNVVTLAPTGERITEFVGFRWYIEAIQHSTTFTVSLIDTVRTVVFSTPIIVVTCLIIAILLNGKFKGRTFFRALFFFPAIVISGPVINELIANNAATIVSPGRYVIYNVIYDTGPLGAPLIFVFDHIVTILWFSEVQILIFLAGLQKISQPLREAASIDGASGWQFFWKITLPFMKPMILLSTIYTIVVLSGFSTNAINEEVTQHMRTIGRVFSYSAAMSWIYFVIVLALLGVVFFLFRDKEKIDI